MKNIKMLTLMTIAFTAIILSSCNKNAETKAGGAFSNASVAEKVYVAPGDYDSYYAFLSGGFSGQITVHGLPSGRLIKTIPVFSVDGEKGYGFNEETKPLLETSYGFVPWDDSHHPELSQTDGQPDGKYVFINANNTPRIARVDLGLFETVEIIEIPNSGGNHSSPFTTQNSEYVVAGTRFSIPITDKDVSIKEYKEKFEGTLSFISVDPKDGDMDLAFQILLPGYDYDLAHAGKGPSHGWMFFSSYNTEKGYTMKEATASQNDKDFIAAVNWKKAEEYIVAGNFKTVKANYYDNSYDESTQMATAEKKKSVKMLIPADCPGLIYYMPTPKSPHGVDVDPSGEYIIGAGKLSAELTVHSFTKMLKAIEAENYEKVIDGIPVLDFKAVNAGVVKSGGLGPLHTEFDGKGNAYTSFFISSEVVKWKLGTWEVTDRVQTYYSIGHLMIPGGDSKKPWGEYLLALNKITKDRYLPTGPELAQSAQLFDISGDKMELLLDFPTMGEPHYAQGIAADKIVPHQVKLFKLEENNHPHAVKTEAETRVERDGNIVHVYMTTIRSHFAPDWIEGIKVGDEVYFHITNLEQDFDVPHGFAIRGANNAELLIMPGQTETLKWIPKNVGIVPFYCTDFCSALHQEMQGYLRVQKKGTKVGLTWGLGEEDEEDDE
jgi:nitrous-oxide reductase